jgi:hypothetical protein
MGAKSAAAAAIVNISRLKEAMSQSPGFAFQVFAGASDPPVALSALTGLAPPKPLSPLEPCQDSGPSQRRILATLRDVFAEVTH